MSRIRPWRLLRSEMVFEHHWYRLRRDWLVLPDGRRVDDYFVSMRPEVVMVFALTPDDEVVMVRQYKHGAGQLLLECPGGTFWAGKEDAAVAAARELAEETGYTSATMEFLGTAWDDPTRQDNRLHFFLARQAQRTQAQHLDEHEDIEVVLVPRSRLRRMCLSDEVCVTGTISLVFRALARLSGTD